MTEQITSLIWWDGPRPAARDVARFLAAWLASVVTRRPLALGENGSISWLTLTVTPARTEA